MKKKLENITRTRYIVGFIILLVLRASFFPTFERELLGNSTASLSLGLGMLLLLALLMEWIYERFKIEPFMQNFIALAIGLGAIVFYNSEFYLGLFALGIGLLARGSKASNVSSNKIFTGFIVLASMLLFANFYLKLTWLLFLLIAVVIVGSFFLERAT